MNTVRIQVAVSGTDDQGNARSFSASGTIVCSGATDGTIEATTSQTSIHAGTSPPPSWAYIENHGTVDVAIGYEDGNGNTVSFAIPPDAAQLMPLIYPLGQHAFSDLAVWTVSRSASVRYILFY